MRRRFESSPTARRAERQAARARGERGLAIVEFAIVAPLLALIVAGILEFGTAWRDKLTVSNGTRAAARVVSNLGDNRQADREALETLRAALASMDDVTIEGILIYDASAADGAPSPSCFDGAGNARSSAGQCNYYTETQLNTLTQADFLGTTSCTFPSPDRYFCPTSRSDDQGAGLTPVGVWVEVTRGWYTELFPGEGYNFSDRAVMNVEPGD